MSPALQRYIRLLDEILQKRSLRPLDEEEEERFAAALNDCRCAMSQGEEEMIAKIVADAFSRWEIDCR